MPMLGHSETTDPETEHAPVPPGMLRKRVVMTAMRRALRTTGGEDRFTVRRGAVNWSKWSFDKHPVGVAIMCDETTFLNEPGHNRAALTLEMMTRMPADQDEMDDALLEDLGEELTAALLMLSEMRDPADELYPVVTKMEQHTSSLLEVSNADLQVQGLIATVFVEF